MSSYYFSSSYVMTENGDKFYETHEKKNNEPNKDVYKIQKHNNSSVETVTRDEYFNTLGNNKISITYRLDK